MKVHSSQGKASRSASAQAPGAPAGENGAALAPPAYGIDFVDRGMQAAAPNRTGMPDRLKDGIESLSGLDLSGVRVSFNSARPAQLNAAAYAQGNEIHLGPGQQHHLPHEAWHVVQQAQGRVKPTGSVGGTAVNDDQRLENEATEMGNRSLQLKTDTEKPRVLTPIADAGESAPVQGAWYLKCIQNPANMAGEIQRLQGASPLDTGTFGGNNAYGMPVEINKWLEGGAGISTTHYNAGQNQYYSPVGFVVDVPPAGVLGNFEGDGNTSTLHTGSPRYWATFEMIRAGMTGDLAINAEINGNGYAAGFAPAVTNLATAGALRGRIEAFLADGHVAGAAKAATRVMIKALARQQLIDHYQNGGFQHPLGPGGPAGLANMELNLQGLAAGAAYHDAVQNRDIKYTESQVHAQLGHVIGTFYTMEAGVYPDLINTAWRDFDPHYVGLPANAGDPNWLNNRAAAAANFRQQFITAGNPNVNVMRLQAGVLANAPAPQRGWLPLVMAGLIAAGAIGLGAYHYYNQNQNPQ